jgi:hypothetical protein
MKFSFFPCLFAALFAASLISGCYESGKGNQDAATDPVPDGVTDTISDSGQDLDALTDPDEIDQVMCQYGADFLAQFDKSCMDESDCDIVHFANDCCGTPLAAGVNLAEVDRFNDIWSDCMLELPMCNCPAGPTLAEDGNSAPSGEYSILVECQSGRCMSYMPQEP